MKLEKLEEAYPKAKVKLWAEDEARLGLKPVIRRVWALVGRRPIRRRRWSFGPTRTRRGWA